MSIFTVIVLDTNVMIAGDLKDNTLESAMELKFVPSEKGFAPLFSPFGFPLNRKGATVDISKLTVMYTLETADIRRLEDIFTKTRLALLTGSTV